LTQHVGGAVGGQPEWGSGGYEMSEQYVQVVDGLGAGFSQVVTVFHQRTHGGD
jgi:hypothetical protein